MNMYMKCIGKHTLHTYFERVSKMDAKPTRQDYYKMLDSLTHSLMTPITDEYLPISFYVSVRTDTTNELVVFPDTGSFILDCTEEFPESHPLDDLVILAAKKCVDHLFDVEDLSRIIVRTTLYPLGAFFKEGKPVVYVNIVMDSTLRKEPFFKCKGTFKSITSLKPKKPFEKELLNSLAIVKGDK